MPVNVDLSSVMAGLDKLTSPQFRESLGRSMAVAGGKVFRDEAKRWVPVESGLLQSAIYLAYRDGESNANVVKYKVSWNAKKAPHGHLVEFGHWQPYKVVMRADGTWFTDVTQPLPQPKWVAAKPFLRPAYDVASREAMNAMMQRGRERVPELLREMYNDTAEFV